MNYENQDIEISLKNMFFSALYQWKKLLAIGILFALILGSYKGISGFSILNDPEEASELKQEYEDDLTYYESKLEELEENVKTLKDARDTQREYLANSVLMQIDASNVAEAKAHLYISTDYQIIPGSFYQDPDDRASIIHAYESIIRSDTLLDNITEETGLETRYVKELVSVSSNSSAGTIDIYVVHKDTDSAEGILNTILSYINNMQKVITQSIANHELNEITKAVGVSVYPDLSTTQANAKKQLTTIEQELASTESALENLTEPQKVILAVSDVIVDIILWAVIGTVVGVILGGIWFCFMFLISNKVYSDDELEARFGLRILGNIVAPDKKYEGITAFLRKKENRILANSDENLAVIAASIDNYCNHEGTVLLTGDMDKAVIEVYGQKLSSKLSQVKIVACGSVLSDTKAIEVLSSCDYVVVIEQCNVSRYNNIKKELYRISDSKKPLIGCLVIE